MWVVSDKAMRELLGGDFRNAVVNKQKEKDISIQRLYSFQDVYTSYQGFRKFFKRHLQSIIENICYIDNNSFACKLFKYMSGMK